MTLASSQVIFDPSALPPAKPKIDSLTSLRFFAAAMIVVYHSQSLLKINGRFASWGMDQGVSFFFVLSGFVLTYVYPSMKSAGGAGRFLLARFARIWPAHITALFAVLYVDGYLNRGGWRLLPKLEFVSCVAMVQSWIPLYRFINFGNGPSWSISTEFFFYLCFPLLITRWEKTWPWKLAGAAVFSAGVLWFCKLARLPTLELAHDSVNIEAITYNNPLGRIFEFIVGMCAAQAWRIFSPRYAPTKFTATLVEFLALIFAIASGYYSVHLPDWTQKYLGVAEIEWIFKGGLSCFSFGLLIVVMSFQKGWISAALSMRPIVLLGELSFSVYLLQLCLFDFYYLHIDTLHDYSRWVSYSMFWALLLTMSYVAWSAIERPCRTMIVSLWPSHQPAKPRRAASANRSLYNPSWKWTAVVCVLMIALMGLVRHATSIPLFDAKEIDKLHAADILTTGPKYLRGAVFGGKFTLLAAKATRTPEGVKVQMVWQSNADQPLTYSVAIQTLEEHGYAIGVIDVPQNSQHAQAKTGSLWKMEILVPNETLKKGTSLALVVHMRDKVLTVDRGPRDANNTSLLIRIP